ncbi:MAG: aldo/keto reductase [Thermoplasmata archaeon]
MGSAQFGLDYGINNTIGRPSKKEIFKILEVAYENGIKKIDTATSYGNALDIISEFHKCNSKIRFDIINKLLVRDFLDEKSFVCSIEKLDIPHYNSVLFHSFEEFKILNKKVLKKINEYIKKDLIKKIGVSVYTNDEFFFAIDNNVEVICQVSQGCWVKQSCFDFI